MKVYLVTKAPLDLDDAFEVIGVFENRADAEACLGPLGTFNIFTMDMNRQYRGDLYDVRVVSKTPLRR